MPVPPVFKGFMKAEIVKYDGERMQYFLLDREEKELKLSDISMPTFLACLFSSMRGEHYVDAVDTYSKIYGLSRDVAELLIKRGPFYTNFFEKVIRRSVWKNIQKDQRRNAMSS